MKIDSKEALSLAAVVRNDLLAIESIEKHVATILPGPLSRADVESLGFSLHNIYNALENSFTQISLSFENHVREHSKWHRELLNKMFLDLGELRPAILPQGIRALLSDMLGFRHLFRHAYNFELEESKTLILWQRWEKECFELKTALQHFADKLQSHGRD